MRATFQAVAISAILLSGGACKKTESDPTGAHQTDVDKANAELSDARTKYIAAAKERLARIDKRIDELGQRANAESNETVAKLRVRRDQIAASLDKVSHQAASGWADFKQDVERGVDSLEQDINNALK